MLRIHWMGCRRTGLLSSRLTQWTSRIEPCRREQLRWISDRNCSLFKMEGSMAMGMGRGMGSTWSSSSSSFGLFRQWQGMAMRNMKQPRKFSTSVVKPKKKKKPNRYKALVHKYGMIVVVFHTGIWALVLAGIFVALHHDDFDIDFVMDYLIPTSMEDRKEELLNIAHSTYGKFLIAYILTMGTAAPRLGITIVATPWLANVIHRINSPLLNRLLLKNPYMEKILNDPMSFFRRSKNKQSK